ncbi:hypothetical protein AGOR_G00012590 [Albula goreensis]|uniref:V-SNARE coiled-coil homology domain-containing protein n=1 Tax=Albula goreensis TaxID=1534307 RepID=A0A8T3E9X1_9TELE|nr:hypothetical protein AGOR_G00012590 [Albula goreensis]
MESNRLQQAQEAVEEVKVIMQDNLNKAEDRGEKLKDLEVRADLIRQKSMKFQKTAVKVKQRKRCENIRMKVLLVAVAVVLLLAVVIIAALASKSTDSPDVKETSQEGAITTVAQTS